MALTNGTLFAISASATTGNVNGAGFNPLNANFPTDGVIASGTTASPTLTSATYSFGAGDVGALVYFPAQTNMVAGWYPIASVAGGVATLTASIGQVSTIGATGIVTYTTSAGCATTSAPTGVKYGVDYSQQNTAQITITDAASVGSSSTLTSVSALFTPVMVGNFFHQTTTGTGAFGVVGWYEIVSYNSTSSIVLDRTPNTGTASVACTAQVGGAGRLNGLENTFQAMIPAAAIVWVKNGSYTLSANISTAGTNCTSTNPGFWIGYNATRGDACNQGNRPVIIAGANSVAWSQDQFFYNIIFTTTAAAGITFNASSGLAYNCKVTNTSSTATRSGFTATVLIACEAVSQNGIAVSGTNTPIFFGNYIHDSATGLSMANPLTVMFNLFECNTTADVTMSNTTGLGYFAFNTLYGREAQMGIGLNLSGANSPLNRMIGNIIYGHTTGISVSTGNANTNVLLANDFYNNTTDVTNIIKGPLDIAVNPNFLGASQLTGTTATSSGSVLTDSGQAFGVTANVDYLHVISGTGVTVGCYLITSFTSTTLTVNNALGTSNTGNIVYFVSHGHNFQVPATGATAGMGAPTFTNTTGGQVTSYPFIGAFIPQSSSGGGGTYAYTFAG